MSRLVISNLKKRERRFVSYGTKTNRIILCFYPCEKGTWKAGRGNVVGCSLLGLIADSLSGGVSDIASDYPK